MNKLKDFIEEKTEKKITERSAGGCIEKDIRIKWRPETAKTVKGFRDRDGRF